MKNSRQYKLRKILDRYFKPGDYEIPRLTVKELKRQGVYNEFFFVYRNLGGVMDEIPIKFGSWDIVYEDFILELDEEQHFNRYRRITLDSWIYSVDPYFNLNQYKYYCKIYEDNCLHKASYGKYWASNSTIHQFGPASQIGDLNGNGSPRWKQRAFYDYLRDIYSVVYKIPVVRISIYDKVGNDNFRGTVNDILTAYHSDYAEYIVNLITERISEL